MLRVDKHVHRFFAFNKASSISGAGEYDRLPITTCPIVSAKMGPDARVPVPPPRNSVRAASHGFAALRRLYAKSTAFIDGLQCRWR